MYVSNMIDHILRGSFPMLRHLVYVDICRSPQFAGRRFINKQKPNSSSKVDFSLLKNVSNPSPSNGVLELDEFVNLKKSLTLA